jgi:hypothetical protein
VSVRSELQIVSNFDVVARHRASRFTPVERSSRSRHGGVAMSVVSSPVSNAATSEERWARWQARGRNQDVRLMRRAKGLLRIALLVVAVIGAFLLGR